MIEQIKTFFKRKKQFKEKEIVVSDFLWKPVSQVDGNLVILLNPANCMVIVNGHVGYNTGSSNGRETTSRFDISGEAMGDVAKVEVYLNNRRIKFPNGMDYYLIKNTSIQQGVQ